MDQERIGKFISEMRRENNMTQEDLADKMGVTAKSISRWENGKTMPDISMLGTLSKNLNCTIPELLKGRKMTNKELIELKETIDNLIEYESDRQVKNDKKLNKYNIVSFITLNMVVFNNIFGYLDYILSPSVAEFIEGFLYGMCLWGMIANLYNRSHNISICEKKKELIKKISKGK